MMQHRSRCEAQGYHQLAEASEDVIELAGVNKWFGDLHVLHDIDLSVPAGGKVFVCGPSGSGKSTMIRCINGLAGGILLRAEERAHAVVSQPDPLPLARSQESA